MEIKKIETFIKVYKSVTELDETAAKLIKHAHESSNRAYARYSHFRVGAAVLLENGEVIEGNNQENAAYPSSLCAERVAVFFASSKYPDKKIKAIAVTAHSDMHRLINPITPCGACRQVLSEYEVKQREKIRVLLTGDGEEIWEVESINDLLPLLFSASSLEGK